MPQYKVTFIFNQNRLGWSETWYINLSNLTAVKDATNNLAKKRVAMLGTGSNLEAWRISDVARPRQCGLYAAPAFPQFEEFTDTAWNGALVEVCAGDAEYRRNVILRGVPDSGIVFSGVSLSMELTNVLRAKHDQWCTALKTGWQLRVISKDELDVNKRDVGALAAGASGNVTVVIPGTTATEGGTIRFSDFKGPDAFILNHVFRVVKVTGDVVEIRLEASGLNLNANTGGKAWHHKIVYRAITDCTMLRPAKKSTGRAFFVPRGRQRV